MAALKKAALTSALSSEYSASEEKEQPKGNSSSHYLTDVDAPPDIGVSPRKARVRPTLVSA